MALYNNRTRGFFLLFTEFKPWKFVRRLTEYLKDRKDVIAELSQTEWQVSFTVERELDDEEIKKGVEADFCDIRVDLLKMP
jgi:nitroreductase